MQIIYDLTWFKTYVAPKMIGYELEYRFWNDGDFCSLNQVQFNSEKMGGAMNFWGQGWTGIHLVDYSADVELLNILLVPTQESAMTESFSKLLEFLNVE